MSAAWKKSPGENSEGLKNHCSISAVTGREDHVVWKLDIDKQVEKNI